MTDSFEIAADDFLVGMFETALASGEAITAVHVPKPKRVAYAKFSNPASRYAVVGVFVAETPDGIRVFIIGAATSEFRHGGIEGAWTNNFAPGAIEGIGGDAGLMNSDIYPSAEFRANLDGVIARRATASLA